MDKEQLGRKQTAKTKKLLSKAQSGKKNSQYKDGRRMYRKTAKAKKGEGVDHIDGNSKNNKKSNLKTFKLKGKERTAHEKKHKRHKNFKSSGGRKTPKRGYKAKRITRKKKKKK